MSREYAVGVLLQNHAGQYERDLEKRERRDTLSENFTDPLKLPALTLHVLSVGLVRGDDLLVGHLES